MATRKLEVLITGNAKGAQKALGDLEKAGGRAGTKTESSLSKANKALVGFGAGAAIYGAFKAFDDAQKVTAQTEAVLKSTGNAANVTAKEVEGLAGAMSKKTGIDDEAIQSGENLLLTFKNIRNEAGEGNDIFNQTAQAALDMSVAMGTDMSSASVMLGKALNDPVKGLSKLTKVGVTFTDQQKSQIKTMAESGDTLGAQKVILQELTSEFGGSAEAQATALGKAKVAVDNMAESVGGALAPALENAASILGTVAEGFSSLPEGAQQAIIGFGLAAGAALKWHDAIGTGLSAMKTGVSTISGFASALGTIDTMAAERGLSRVDTLLNVLDSGGNKKTAGVVRGIDSVIGAMGGLPMAGAVAAGGIGLMVAAYIDMTNESKNAAKGAQSLIDLADQTGSSLTEAFNTQLAKTIAGVEGGIEGLGESSDTFGSSLEEAGVSVVDLATAIHGSDAQFDSFMRNLAKSDRPMFETLHDDLNTMRSSAELADEKTGKLSTTQKLLGVVAEKTGGQESTLGDRTDDSARSSEEASVSHQRNADALEAVRKKAQDAEKAISDFYDEQTAQVSSQIDVERALDGVTQSFKDNGLSLNIGIENGRKNREAIIAAKDAQVAYAETLRQGEGGTAAAIQSMSNYSLELYDTMVQSGLTKDQATALIDEMGLTPTDIWTTYGSNATEAEAMSAAVKASIDAVPGWKDIYFNALTDEALYQIGILSQSVSEVSGSVLSGTAGAAIQQSQAAHKAAHDGKRKDNAAGGSVRSGDWGWVGEKGPEMVNWGTTARVYPHKQSMAMAGGGGRPPIIVNVQGNVFGIDDLAGHITDAINKQTRMNGKSRLRTSLTSVDL